MNVVRWLIPFVMCLYLASCVPSQEVDSEVKEGLDDSFAVSEGAQTDPPAPNCYKDEYLPPKESITRKLDILIIPDTSASIKEERRRIAEGFDYFVSALPKEVDFNIGVILGHSNNSNKSGKLYKKNSKDPLVLKSKELSIEKIKEALSLKIHKPKTDGYSDGGEMGLASLLNALEGNNLQDLKDNGLLRDDAALAVIFVADEQDICAKAPEGITLKEDPQTGERKSFVKYCIEEDLNWKNVTIGGDYTYKITPQIVLDKLRNIKGDMPLVVGGVLYDELSTIPTGNEDEIGYGYLETIRLSKGINVDLASGDYRDGLTRLGKLATSSFDAPQSFDLSIIPDISTIETFVDNVLVPYTYDSLANKVFLVDERSPLSTARIEYCEKQNTPPVIALNAGPLEGVAPLEVTIDGSSSTDDVGIASYSLVINGESFYNSTGVFSYTFSVAGEYEAIFKAIDSEGLTSVKSVSFSITSAPIAPIANFTLSKTSGRVPFSTTLDASSSSDPDSSIVKFDLSVNGVTTSQEVPIFNLDFNSAGTFNLILTVTDSQGLSSSKSQSIEALPALIAPTASFSINPTSGRVPQEVKVDASGSNDTDGTIVKYDLSINGSVISQTTPIFSFNVTEANTYNLVLTVTDSDGLVSSSNQTVTYEPALIAPVAAFVVNPNSGRVPQDVTVDASNSTDTDGSIVKYDLFVNDNLVSQTSPIFSFNVDEAGTFNLRLVVTDNDGLTSEFENSVTYIPALVAPIASLTATPAQGEVPFNITLDASASSDSDGQIVRYVFSDGTDVVESTNPTLTFIQETPGTYNYTVEVTDNDGLKSSATAQVVAKPKTTNEESALLAYYKFNLIPTGGNTFNLELIFEGRSLNGKAITEAFYSTTNGDRLDVGRAILGHIDVIPVELDSPLELSLNVKDELGGVAVYTHTINSDSLTQAPLLSVDSIEYASNNMVFFSNLFHDPYGQLDGFANYQIDFGDGTTQDIQESSFQVTHAYPSAGDFLVKITAFGNNGRSFSVEETIAVSGEVNPFKFPLADFRVEKAPWAPGVRLYVDQSLSPNSPIKTYLWELGDGTTAFGREVIHFYQAGGYDVTLTAILEDGTQSVVKREIIIMNDASNIVSNLDCWDIGNLTLECEFSAADKFNDLSLFNIHFGDSEVIPENIISQSVSGGLKSVSFTHTYQNSGNYTVSYQVISGRGEDLIKARDFSVTDAPGNLPPVADLSCFSFYDQVDCQAYGSFDPDGFITEFKFSFGNGESLTTDTPQTFYTYPEVGTYTVTLEVTDNFGTTSTTSQVVTLEERINQFPVPNLSCVSNNPNELTCDGISSYDSDGSLVYGKLTSVDTGETFETEIIQDLEYTFSFGNGGQKTIQLEVADDQGALVSTQRVFFVEENYPPVAIFECDNSSIGVIRCFGGSSFDENGPIVNYEWTIDGDKFYGENVTVENILLDEVVVSLTVFDSTGLSTNLTKTVTVYQNTPPQVSFYCFSGKPWNLSCVNESSDPDNQTLSHKWIVDGSEYFTEDLNNLLLNRGGSFDVSLVVNDGIIEKNLTQSFEVLENNLPNIGLNCDNSRDFYFSCNLNATDSDGHSLTVEWYRDGLLLQENGNILSSKEFGPSTTIKARVTDELGEKSEVEEFIQISRNSLDIDILCNQINNTLAECDASLTGFQEPIIQWSINGIAQDVFERNIVFEHGGVGSLDIGLNLSSNGENFSDSTVFEVREMTPNEIKSNASLKLVKGSEFLNVDENLQVVIESGSFALDEEGGIKLFEVYNSESDGPSPIEVIEQLSSSITIKTTLLEGNNDLFIRTLDQNENLVEGEISFVAGSKLLELDVAGLGNGVLELYFSKDLTTPFWENNISDGILTIQNFPKLDVLISLGEYPRSLLEVIKMGEVRKNLNLLEKDFVPNTQNQDFRSNTDSWYISGATVEVNEVVAGFEERGRSISFLPSSSELIRIESMIKAQQSRFFEFPISFNSNDEKSFFFARAQNLRTKEVSYTGLFSKDIVGLEEPFFNIELPKSSKEDLVSLEIIANFPLNEGVTFLDYLNPFSVAVANDGGGILRLWEAQSRAIRLSNPVFKDGQQHDVGKELITFISGNLPPTYNQKNVWKENVYKVRLGASNWQDVLSNSTLVDLNVCGASGNISTCNFFKRLSCFESNIDGDDCIIYFSEDDIQGLYGLISATFSISIDGKHSLLKVGGKPQNFTVLRSLSGQGFVGGFNESEDRYGSREGLRRQDDEDGGDDWYAASHERVITSIMNASATYNGLVYLARVDDISPTGVSSRRGFRHTEHESGLNMDIRFVKDSLPFSEIIQGEVVSGEVSRFEADADGVISLIKNGQGAVDRILVSNSLLSGKTSVKTRNSLRAYAVEPFLTKLALTCAGGLYPLGWVRNAAKHTTHVDVRFQKLNKAGSVPKFTPSNQNSPPVAPPKILFRELPVPQSPFNPSGEWVFDMEIEAVDGFEPYQGEGAIINKYIIAYRDEDGNLVPITKFSDGLYLLDGNNIIVNKDHKDFKKAIDNDGTIRKQYDLTYLFLWGDEEKPTCSKIETKYYLNMGECELKKYCDQFSDRASCLEETGGRDYIFSYYPNVDSGGLKQFCYRYQIPVHQPDSEVQSGEEKTFEHGFSYFNELGGHPTDVQFTFRDLSGVNSEKMYISRPISTRLSPFPTAEEYPVIESCSLSNSGSCFVWNYWLSSDNQSSYFDVGGFYYRGIYYPK